MNILISGAGVAGPTLAYWLGRYGLKAVIVEEAPKLRAGGHIIDFWGAGYEVAEKMGIIPGLAAQGYPPRAVKLVDFKGRRVGGFSAEALSDATGGKYVSIPRADLSAAIHRTIAEDVEIIWGDVISSIEPSDSDLRVGFQYSPARRFDLVIGADGLHSNVRGLCFGAPAQFETPLGYNVAAFEAPGYKPREDEFYVCYTLPGVEISRFALRNDRTMFLFVFKDDAPDQPVPKTVEAQKNVLRRRFESAGWECAEILRAMDSSEAIYFDRMSQVHMDAWAKGRVALVGDACFCPTLLSGEGAALSMVGAYILAGELSRANGDYAQAFTRYETLLRPFLEEKQKNALALAASFVPSSNFAIAIRNLVTHAFFIPFIRQAFLGRNLRNDFPLPDYSVRARA